jgi:hypothetical protein
VIFLAILFDFLVSFFPSAFDELRAQMNPDEESPATFGACVRRGLHFDVGLALMARCAFIFVCVGGDDVADHEFVCLCVAEKPSIAKVLAESLANERAW